MRTALRPYKPVVWIRISVCCLCVVSKRARRASHSCPCVFVYWSGFLVVVSSVLRFYATRCELPRSATAKVHSIASVVSIVRVAFCPLSYQTNFCCCVSLAFFPHRSTYFKRFFSIDLFRVWFYCFVAVCVFKHFASILLNRIRGESA